MSTQSSNPVAEEQPTVRSDITVPDIAVLSVFGRSASLLTVEGELKTLSREQAILEINNNPVLVCHAPYTRHRIDNDRLKCFDILELYAFVHPGRFTVPTPTAMAQTLGITIPQDTNDYPHTLHEAMKAILSDFAYEVEQFDERSGKKDPLAIAATMGQQGKGWVWTPYLFAACGIEYNSAAPLPPRSALATWKNLPEWAEEAPLPPPSHHAVSEDESEEQLEKLLQAKHAETRPQQIRYARQMTAAFSPLGDENIDEFTGEVNPHIVLAEAGTGVGKTLGYIAPSSVWAEKNDGAVWISTYTKNLQRQIDQELDKLYPNPELKDQHVAVRKGRENYLCLLNLEDMSASAGIAKSISQAVAAGIMSRWAEVSKDGDMQGGDFPGWIPALLGYRYTRSLSDTRGECIFSACDHYHRCFVERASRKAKRAKIVVANHAVVMTQTALSSPIENLPERYVFDEGHHLFHAADSAFAAHLTARETHDLRRWLLGPEGGSRQSRARGLKKRVEDLIADDSDLTDNLEAILFFARQLPAFGWSKRMKDRVPQGDTETFLLALYDQVYSRAKGKNGPYSIETETHPITDSVQHTSETLQNALRKIQKPMQSLSKGLQQKLSDHADTLDTDTKKRLEAVAAGIDRRCDFAVTSWIDMLGALLKNTTPEQYVDWMEVERIDGKAIDVGLYRHWVDPMKPFAMALKPHAHGVAVTSATLCDRTDDMDENWRVAQEISGAKDLSPIIMQFQENSPYDYAQQSRVFIISDVNKNNMQHLAASYRALFQASQGSALGLFTAIQRLRDVYGRIREPLEHNGLSLYAQHCDDVDTATLVDMFREDKKACLLGTDAMRDGVDVPGDSLQLLVYDRVPWPRPTLLHKARKKAFGGSRYDELSTRLKLRQAFGRLIRTQNDKGVFVMLDSGLPTRMLSAFPDGVPIERTSLSEAVLAIQSFLN